MFLCRVGTNEPAWRNVGSSSGNVFEEFSMRCISKKIKVNVEVRLSGYVTKNLVTQTYGEVYVVLHTFITSTLRG